MKDTIEAAVISVFTSLGFIGLLFRWQNGKTEKIEKKMDDLDEKYLTGKEHKLLCDNATLRLEQSFEQHFTTLSNEVFKSIRSLEKTINGKNNG